MHRFATVFLALIVLAAPFAFSFDYGVDFTTTSRITTDEAFYNRDALALWTEAPLGERHLFQVRGGYAFSTELPAELVLNRLLIQGDYSPTPNTRFVTQAGRISLREASGLVYNQSVDGAAMRIQAPGSVTRFGIGYTGLHFAPSSQIVVSIADTQVPTDETFATISPRVVGTASVVLSDLLPRQEITLSGAFQEDLRPLLDQEDIIQPGDTEFRPEASGPVDTQYASLGIGGGITSALFYQVWGVYNAGSMLTYVIDEETGTGVYQPTPIQGIATSAGLTYFMPQTLSMRISGKFTYTSGDADHGTYYEGNQEGKSTLYLPVTQSVASIAFAPKLGNVMFGELHLSLRPFASMQSRYLSNLQVSTDGYMFFRSTEGAVSATGVNSGVGDKYLGTEADIRLSYRPFSDLGVGIGFGMFFPNTASSSPMATDQNVKIRARLSTSFSF
jgi:hypothetical protein